jgi:DNA-binding NarL/FixJ family response regulator
MQVCLPVKVVILDPNQFFCTGLEICLVKAGYSVLGHACHLLDLLEPPGGCVPNLVAIGPNFAEPEAFTLCRGLLRRWPNVKLILYTSHTADPLVQVDAFHMGIRAVLSPESSEPETMKTLQIVLAGSLTFTKEILKTHPITLTPREHDVLRLIAEGKSDREIAEAINLRVATVRNYSQQILEKLGVHSRHDALRRARRLGWLAS